MSIDQLKNQMVGEPSRVPGYAEGYGQAPGQARPSMPAQPNPIGRPSLVVGGPAYYTPPGFQAPPQPTEAFLPTDVRPDPIGQQFMRQMESPMGQQFIEQYEATQAPLRQAEQEKQQAELAKRDERFQELMSRISELEGQLGSQEEAPVMPNIPTFPIGDDFEIDFSKIPNFGNFLNFGNQMEPFEREDYQDLMSEINNLSSSPSLEGRYAGLQPPSGGFDGKDDGTYRKKIQQALAEGKPIFGNTPTSPSIDSILAAEQEKADRGIIGRDFADFSTQGPSMPIPGSEIDLSKLDQSVAEKIKRSLAAGMPVFQGPRPGSIIGPSEDRLPPMPMAPQMPKLGGFAGAIPMPGQEQGVNTGRTPQTVNLFGSDVTLGEYGKAPGTKKSGLFGSLSSATTTPSPMAPINLPRPMVPMNVFSKLNKGPGL